jgi:hypothetical protein
MEFKNIDDITNPIKKLKTKGIIPFVLIGGILGVIVFLKRKNSNNVEQKITNTGTAEVVNDSLQNDLQELDFTYNMRISDLEQKTQNAFNSLLENDFINNQNISTQLLDFQSEYRTDLTTVANNVDNLKQSVQNNVQQQIEDSKINYVVNKPSNSIKETIPNTPYSLINKSKDEIPKIIEVNKGIATANKNEALKQSVQAYLSGDRIKAKTILQDARKTNIVDDRPVTVIPRK